MYMEESNCMESGLDFYKEVDCQSYAFSYSKKGFPRTVFFLELFSFSLVQNTRTIA